MTAATDHLANAVASLAAAVDAHAAEVQTLTDALRAAQSNNPDPAIEAAASAIDASVAKLGVAVAAVTPTANPAPAP